MIRIPEMCPHCGLRYDRQICGDGLVPVHHAAEPTRGVCPGSGQVPRNPETDRRPLWSEEAGDDEDGGDWDAVGDDRWVPTSPRREASHHHG